MMYKNLYLFVLFLLVNRVVYGQNFLPGPRVGQQAVLVGDKLYYTGGLESPPLSNSNFFYLDGQARVWVELKSKGVNMPTKATHMADIGGANQDLIFIFGGILEEQNTVYQFDTKTNTLSTPITLVLIFWIRLT
jgi:N-acetylneuraminic acid mutarotase